MSQPQHPAPDRHEPQGAGRRRPNRAQRTLVGATATAVVLGLGAMAVPSPYVVYSPGPAINTLGDVDGEPIIRVSGAESYPTEGHMDLTTIYTRGGGDTRIPFFQALQGWLDPAQDVYPEETMYPRGVTDEQISERNAVEMDDSQQTSVAAALTELDIEYTSQLAVADFAAETNTGVLEPGDVLETINGERITDLTMLRAELQEAGDAPSTLGIRRAGSTREVEAATTASADGQRQLGVFLSTDYDFPFSVDFTLNNVGGPSAGLMFSLGIVDTLTPGDLAGDVHFAGTGTIDAQGQVGPIGGIAQKLIGAREVGAEVFLAPEGNCAAVVGRIPDGLDVVKVATLSDARAAVEGIAQGEDPASYPSCS